MCACYFATEEKNLKLVDECGVPFTRSLSLELWIPSDRQISAKRKWGSLIRAALPLPWTSVTVEQPWSVKQWDKLCFYFSFLATIWVGGWGREEMTVVPFRQYYVEHVHSIETSSTVWSVWWMPDLSMVVQTSGNVWSVWWMPDLSMVLQTSGNVSSVWWMSDLSMVVQTSGNVWSVSLMPQTSSQSQHKCMEMIWRV